ncbi:MAG: shikimate 5-dehydrogenase [Verrucomicrobiota bacterium]
MQITPKTQLCISLAARPGSFGVRFHNYLYAALELDFVYKSCTTSDLPSAIQGIRALGIRGCGLSMPFKTDALRWIDDVDAAALRLGAINTIQNTCGVLKGFNTDYLALVELISSCSVPIDRSVGVLGSGGMARAVLGALRDCGFESVTIFSRSEANGNALAESFQYEWLSSDRVDGAGCRFLINATPIGMTVDSEEGCPFSDLAIEDAEFIFDSVVSIRAVGTPLIKRARSLNKVVISGSDITVLQAKEQFQIYTGIMPSNELVAAAAQYALVK